MMIDTDVHTIGGTWEPAAPIVWWEDEGMFDQKNMRADNWSPPVEFLNELIQLRKELHQPDEGSHDGTEGDLDYA